MPRQYTPKVSRVCAQCGKTFLICPSNVVRKGRGTFCSRECMTERRKRFVVEALENYDVDAKGCWIYRGTKNVDGYAIHSNGRNGRPRNVRLARLILNRDHGIPLEDRATLACHSCDTPACIRPDHIFPGTHAINSADMVAKRRAPTGDRSGGRKHPEKVARGSRQGAAKLTEQSVLEIRRLSQDGKILQKDIAAFYGVDPATIRMVTSRRTWTHV